VKTHARGSHDARHPRFSLFEVRNMFKSRSSDNYNEDQVITSRSAASRVRSTVYSCIGSVLQPLEQYTVPVVTSTPFSSFWCVKRWFGKAEQGLLQVNSPTVHWVTWWAQVFKNMTTVTDTSTAASPADRTGCFIPLQRMGLLIAVFTMVRHVNLKSLVEVTGLLKVQKIWLSSRQVEAIVIPVMLYFAKNSMMAGLGTIKSPDT
jgi:hypothetical protein